MAHLHLFFHNRLLACCMLCAFSLLLSCEKEPEPVSRNSSITGFVYVDVEDYDFSGVTVRAIGPFGTYSAVTDTSGIYWINNVPNGTYILEMSKKDFGTVKRYGIQVFGSDTVQPGWSMIYKLPQNRRIPEFSLAYFNNEWLIIESESQNCGSGIYEIRFFIGTTEDVSWKDYKYTISAESTQICSYFLLINRDNFIPRQKYYIIGYSCNQRDIGYEENYSGLRVFSTLSEENNSIISFTAPEI